MPLPERTDRSIEHNTTASYFEVFRYHDRFSALRVYVDARALLFFNNCDLSVSCFQMEDSSYLSVIGHRPDPTIVADLEQVYGDGVRTTLPQQVMDYLWMSRNEATSRGIWVEQFGDVMSESHLKPL